MCFVLGVGMAIEPTLIQEGVKRLAGWIAAIPSKFHDFSSEKKKQTKEAIGALLAALRETRPYPEQMKGDSIRRDPVVEQRLSGLWANAGVAMLPLNEEVAYLYST